MCSGKSDTLIGEILSAQRRHKRILLVKPTQDTRSGNKIASKKYKEVRIRSKDPAWKGEYLKYNSYQYKYFSLPVELEEFW